MALREVAAKSILRKQKRLDSWFVTRYSMNLYRGCFHDCVYCDGRAETYHVAGTFGRDIEIKHNALAVLDAEIDPLRRRKPLTRCYFLIGGGVNDSYQPAERRYRLTRGALQLLLYHGYPALVLTKSPFVLEDIDLITELHHTHGAIVGCSFSSVSAEIGRVFEPTVAVPEQRLEVIRRFKARGVPCVMFLMPVIPFVTDSAEMLEASLQAGKDAGADYVVFGGLTLKLGRQMDHFLSVLASYDRTLVNRYRALYDRANSWGGAAADYENQLHRRFFHAAKAVGIPVRMPHRLFAPILAPQDRVVVMLEHIDYLLTLQGTESHYGLAARSIAQLEAPLEAKLDRLQQLPGVGPFTDKVVREILSTGTSAFYERVVGSSFTP